MADADAKQERPEPQKKARTIRFAVGANIGSARYEVGDTASANIFSAPTLKSWLDQGLVKEVKG